MPRPGLSLAAFVAAVAGLAAPACADDDAPDCGPLAARYTPPPPAVAGLPGPTLVAQVDKVLVDPQPLTRGEHPAVALADGPRCALVERPVDHVAVAVDPALAPDVFIGAGTPRARSGGLVVLGADVDGVGPAADRQAWDGALAALGVRARALYAPSRAAVEAAITTACEDAGAGGVALLVFTGPGSPAEGGALVLGPEAISFTRLEQQIDAACGRLGLLVLVVDSSYTTLVPTAELAPTPPVVLWSASDARHPEGARLAPHGGGALTAALTAAIVARAGRCDEAPLEPGRAAWLVADDGVRARLLALRWAALGVPALARLAAAGELTPRTRDAVAAALAGPIPEVLARSAGDIPLPGRCVVDVDCEALAGCAAPKCQRWGCDAGACRLEADVGATCDDDDACTQGDACDVRGHCTGAERACDDGNPCTDDACEPAGCVATPRPGEACDDGDPCSDGDACDAAGACLGAPRVCDDGDPCTVDSCDREAPDAPCVARPATLACDDGDACTFADQCRDRVCAGTRKSCADDNPCTADACDPATGACAFVPLADGSPCDDRDACTTLDRCGQGLCRGLARACDDDLACTFDACDDGACTHLPTPGTCLSAAGCIAVGEPDPIDACRVCAATDRFEPVADGMPCPSDGIPCTADVCVAGACRHRDAPDACHDAAGRCVAAGEGLTDCLVCQGGGVAVPAPLGQACGAPLECAHGACDGQGRCDLPPIFPCCPAQLLTCGDTLVLAADNLAGAARVDVWSCDATPHPGPERHASVTATCAGTMTIEVTSAAPDQGPATVLLDAAPCPLAGCSAAGPSHAVAVSAGEVVEIAVEAPTAAGLWVVTTRCACEVPEP